MLSVLLQPLFTCNSGFCLLFNVLSHGWRDIPRGEYKLLGVWRLCPARFLCSVPTSRWNHSGGLPGKSLCHGPPHTVHSEWMVQWVNAWLKCSVNHFLSTRSNKHRKQYASLGHFFFIYYSVLSSTKTNTWRPNRYLATRS